MTDTPRTLAVYLLGPLGFDAALALQRRLVYDLGERRPETPGGAFILCEHPPGITIGREGSREHVKLTPQELHAREWPVRWLARGGGVMLHLPGQVAAYPLLNLQAHGSTPTQFLRAWEAVCRDVVRGYCTPDDCRERPGVSVRGRAVVHIGASVRYGVTAFGAVLNVNPDLEAFRGIHCDGNPRPMTSLARESPLAVRAPAVRQALIDGLAEAFGFTRVSLYHSHPAVSPAVPTHAIAQRR